MGGTGDDQLLGGAGNDTYQFNLGDGIDSISDSMDVAEPNRVVFGSGITSSSITLTTDFGQILVRPGSDFEGVKIGADGSDALGFHAVDLFQFEDGTSLTYCRPGGARVRAQRHGLAVRHQCDRSLQRRARERSA